MAEERRDVPTSSQNILHPKLALRQELLYDLFPLKFIRDDIYFLAQLEKEDIKNDTKGVNFKAIIYVETQPDEKHSFYVVLGSQSIGHLFQYEKKINGIRQYSLKEGAVRMLENLIYGHFETILKKDDKDRLSLDFIPEKEDEDGLSLNGAYIPLDKSIRKKIRKREGLIDALRHGEKIVQVFYGDVTESVPINFVCNVLGLDDQSNIKTVSTFQITMTAEELQEKGFKNNDLAIAVRKALGSKQILSYLEKKEDRTIYSNIKAKNVLNKKDELKRLRLILSDKK